MALAQDEIEQIQSTVQQIINTIAELENSMSINNGFYVNILCVLRKHLNPKKN